MDGDIIARMRSEEADLARKLKAVRDFLAAYGQAPSNDIPAQGAKVQPAAPRGKVGIDGYTPYGRGIVATAMIPMLKTKHPVKTRAIVEFLQGLGVEITGQEPVNAVGALLYRSADIRSHGKAGWTVADESTANEIVSQYAHKENEASHGKAEDASEAGMQGAATLYTPTFGRPPT